MPPKMLFQHLSVSTIRYRLAEEIERTYKDEITGGSMPLKKGSSQKTISSNIREMKKAGKKKK